MCRYPMKGPDWSVIGVGLKVELRNVTPDGGRNDPERFGGSVPVTQCSLSTTDTRTKLAFHNP